MATQQTSLTVTIVTRTDTSELVLSAEIVASDNDDQSTYYVGESYYLRLHKSPNISSLAYNSTIGSISQSGGAITASVPYDPNEPEYLTFTGSDSASLAKSFHSNFSATPIGNIYDENGAATSYTLTAPSPGYTNVMANKKIYGVFEVSYITQFTKYIFSSNTVGPMVIFFIGSGE